MVHGDALGALFLVLLAQLLAHEFSTVVVNKVGHVQEFHNEFIDLGDGYVEGCHIKLNVKQLRGNDVSDLDVENIIGTCVTHVLLIVALGDSGLEIEDVLQCAKHGQL